MRPFTPKNALLLLGLTSVTCLLIGIGQIKQQATANLAICDSRVMMPTLKNASPDFISLNGDDEINLAPGEKYFFHFRSVQLNFELFSSNRQEAVFFYHETISSPGEFEILPQVSEYHCQQHIDYSDPQYTARKITLWPSIDSLHKDWVISSYLEFAASNPPYRLPPQDYYMAVIKAEHRNITLTIPYEMLIGFSTYNTENEAREAFTDDQNG